MKLKKQLEEEILQYCKLNEISDPETFLNNMVEKAFNVEKYGISPHITVPSGDKATITEPKPEKLAQLINEPLTPKRHKDDDYDGLYDN